MTRPVIGITGANGFIGSAIRHYLQDNGYRVISLVRRPQGDERYYTLDEVPEHNLLDDIDVLIHAAYSKSDRKVKGTNFSGSRQLFDLAAKTEGKKIVFISSIAAQPTIQSIYGKSKLEIEKMMPASGLIVRPGLVIGKGGLFGRLLQSVSTNRPVPLLRGGTQPMQCIAIDDLTSFVATAVQNNLSGIFTLVNSEDFSYKTFFEALANSIGEKCRFLPLPASLLLATLSITDKLHIPLPVSAENLRGLLSQQRVLAPAADELLGHPPLTLLAAIGKINEYRSC